MRMVEYQHRNEGGGNMVHLDNATWEHGESVLVVSKRELGDELRLAIFSDDGKDRLAKLIDQINGL